MSYVTILWGGIALLVAGSIYLLVEGTKVHKLFANSIVGRLVKTLVIVLLIELLSLGVVTFAFVVFLPSGVYVLLPVVFLWICSLAYAIYAIQDAHKEMKKLLK